MKITHICHSCFLVELDHTLLLFDYFQGPLPPLDAEKTLFVFSSHRHHDHYSPAVWELSESHPNVFYVLDENIPARRSAKSSAAIIAALQVPERPDENAKYKISSPLFKIGSNASQKRSGVTWLVVGIAPSRIAL